MALELRHRGTQKWLPTTLGVVISAGVSIFIYVKTGLSTAFVAFGGLLGVTIALQLKQLRRSRRVAEDRRQDRLWAQIHQRPWLVPLMEDSMSALDSIERQYPSAVVRELTRQTFQHCKNGLIDLQRGLYRPISASIDSLVERLTERTQTSLLATASDSELNFWNSAAGRHYLKLHQDAHERGVKTQRIFIYRQWTPHHDEVAHAQHRIGVEVYTIPQTNLPKNQLIGIVIWDKKIAFELGFNVDGEETSAYCTFAEQDVAILMEKYEAILRDAQPWQPRFAPLSPVNVERLDTGNDARPAR